MLPLSFNFDVGCDIFRLKTLFGLKTLWLRFFSLVHGQVNWKKLLVRSNTCTTRTTRTIDFATPATKLVKLVLLG